MLSRFPLPHPDGATEAQCHAFRQRLAQALPGATLLVVRDAESCRVEAINAEPSWVELARTEAPRLWSQVLRERPATVASIDTLKPHSARSSNKSVPPFGSPPICRVTDRSAASLAASEPVSSAPEGRGR